MEPTGSRLKKLRLEKGIALEEIQKKTKIHSNILRAIEGDAVTNLNPVYLKSFLKIYCKFLGVDYREYLGDYKEAEAAQETKDAGDTRMETGPLKARPPSFFKSASVKLKSMRPNKRISKAFIVALAAIFLFFGLVKIGKAIFSRKKAVISAGQPAREAKRKVAAAKVKTKSAGNKDKAKAEAASGIRLGIRAKDNCWVTLKVDGKIVFQRVLTKGRFESWKAKEKMQLSLGNAGAVELEVNGRLFSNLGRRGQPIKNIVITREGIDIPR